MVKGDMDKYEILLVTLFLIAFLSRLFFAFQTPNFSQDSYYQLRHIEHIQETGLPLYNDPLSYEGREYYYPPLFHYFMALMGFFFSLPIAAKIIPSLLFSTLIFLVYGISHKITKDKLFSLLAATFFTFAPVSYTHPINNVSPYSLAMPLFFLAVYFMLDIKKNLDWLLITVIALVFTHPAAFILVMGMLFYLLLLKLEGLDADKTKKETILFTMFLVFWALFLLYKKVFLIHGMDAVWQNLPTTLIKTAFPTLSIFQIIYFIGMVPLFLGMIGAYGIVFKKPDKKSLFILSLTLAVAILLWLSFLRIQTGMLFLSILLPILSAQGLKARSEYMQRTKFAASRTTMIASLLFFFAISSILPLYGTAMTEAQRTPDQEVIDALKWAKNNTPSESVMMAPVSEGHLLTYFADRKNVMDTNFIMVKDVNQRFKDVSRMYTVRLKSEAVRIATKYQADYLLFGETAKLNYDVEKLHYVDDKCFKKVYDDGFKIYAINCTVGGIA